MLNHYLSYYFPFLCIYYTPFLTLGQELFLTMLNLILDNRLIFLYNMCMNKRWTQDDKQYLRDNYKVIPTAAICEKLQVTESQLYSQIHYLRKRGWTFGRSHLRNQESHA
jgi:hypothetical protein